jgi:aquaporin Z
MKASRSFYRDRLGLTIVGESLNYGGEQELLSGVAGARVQITSFRGVKGPGIELLHYEVPGTADTFPREPERADMLHWQINLRASRQKPSAVHDLDGHALNFLPPAADEPRLEYAREALRQHWSRYLMEGAELGIFMIVALYLTIALEHPRSPLRRAISSGLLRRFLVGLGIGLTVVALIYCQWGRQSGAQFNPSVTLARLSLTKIEPWDAVFYILAQFAGGWLLLVVAGLPFRRAAAQEKVKWVATEPGEKGAAAAFAAEFLISFLILFSLLLTIHFPPLKPWIGLVAGLHLCAFITLESPFSGMSLNPARTVASALPARSFKALWVYFVAPPLAMLLAARICRWWVDS